MSNIFRISLVVFALTALPTVARAKGGTPQNHHCMKDGVELAGKTKKECKKEGGKWDKDKMPPAPDAPGKAANDMAPKTTP